MKKIMFGIISILFLLGGVVIGIAVMQPTQERLIEQTIAMKEQMAAKGKYRCCLTEPCTHCFMEHEEEHEEVGCDCMDEVLKGEAPCGECIGEILEGEGNPALSQYFPQALADALGEEHLPTLKKIIEAHYSS